MAAECGIAVGASIVTEVAKSLYRTMKQEIFYAFKYQSYVDDLNNQVQQLRYKREREQLRVDHATRQGDEIHKDVDEWLTKVNEFMLNELINQVANPNSPGDAGRAKIFCFNFMARYKVGKKAVKATKDGSNLLGKKFKDVAHRPGPQRTASMYVRDYEAFDSRESVLQEIMEALKDANVNRIGVYGMGGVGKTTLVKKVAWQTIDDKLFDDVVMAEVTQKPDYKKIQDKLACDLGLEFGQNETEFDRAQRLRNSLKKRKRVLVILDNIWAKPDFEAIGIPFRDDDQKESSLHKEGCKEMNDDDQRLYKILVTSRSLDVLRNDMDIQKNFPVETLSSEEARNLFWKIVGDYHSAKCSTDFETVAEIVGKCAGLPLAIATIANALKNKSIDAWEDALYKLRTANPRSIPEVDERVVSVLELSFDYLQSDEAKKLFLLCSLVDCGQGTSHDYLLRYGMGWGLFQNVYTLESGRKRLNMLIDNLKASCLLLEGDTNQWVKMHEFVHAVAISIASTSNLMFTMQDVPDLNKVLEEKISGNPTAISLPYRDISVLPERLGCPKLELFFLFMKSPSLQMPNNFFEGMKQLKVIDCDTINLQSLPSSFGYLTNLQTLCLDGCLLGDIATIGELKSLEILSFSRSSIAKLPKEMGKLTRLKLLDLSRCSELKVIAANVISSLSRLEELYLDNSSVHWENGFDNQDGCNANLDELNQLSHLTTLNICFPDAQIIPPKLLFQLLKRYRILIGDGWSWSHRNEASRTLKLKLHNNSYLGYKPIKLLLKRTEDLFLDELNGIQNVLHELDEEGFPNLKHLHVQNGSELLYIVNSAGRIHHNAFPILEALSLNNLINLEKICHGPLKEGSFKELKTVKVNNCDGLKYLFSISMAKSLSQLQEIEVTDCENLKVIFIEEDDEGCAHVENQRNSKFEFAWLRSLTLQQLPQFTNFSINVKTPLISQPLPTEITTDDDHENFKTLFGKRVEYPSLENLKLSSISIEKIWPEKLLSMAFYCQTVRSLTLEDCNGLKFLFSPFVVKSFGQLQRLVLCNCESMEEVLDTKGLGGEESVSFPKLFFLELKDLPKLTRFGNGNIIKFPSLNVLTIGNCPNLRTFFSNNICTDMNSVENLQVDNQPLFGDKVGLPSLEVLIVYQMGKLRKIWDDRVSLDLFCKIKNLSIRNCNELLNIFPSDILGGLQTLENLEVMNCDSLEEVFELQALSGQTTPAIAATELRELHLCHLPNLKHVWNMNAQAILASENLIKIRVHSCPSLKSLFPASIASDLLKLEELEILTCLLEEIVAKDDKVEEAIIPRFMFPRLTLLTLRCLPVLKNFYPERHISDWPVLKKMEVSGCTTGCGTMEILASEFLSLQQTTHCESQLDHQQPIFCVDKVAFPSLEELKLSYLPKLLHLWGENSQASRIFQNLATLEVSVCKKLKTLVPSFVSLWNLENLDVSECDELKSLVTLSTSKSLVNLTRINIADCKMIEEIITHMEDKANIDDQIVLKKLNYLRLRELPNLTSFCCLGNYAIKLPVLEKVIVGHCPKMMMLEKVHLKEGEGEGYWQDNLDTTRQQLLQEMVGFRGLKYLKISEFPQLKQIWHDQFLPGRFFSNLTSLVVDKCADMSSAISANLLQFLNNLEMLEVRNCDSLEQVFDLEEFCVDGHPELLSQLSHFYLIDLPKLSYMGRGRHLEILGFKNLKFLEVLNCGGLRYMFTASIISSLMQLQELKIINCATMEVIMTKEEGEDAADKIALPLLNSIILESLPDLTSFYSGRKILECPSLKTITITNCTKMEAFAFTNMKELHLHTGPLLSDKVQLPALDELRLSSMAIEMICHDKLLASSYTQNLKFLDIYGCDNLRYLFPFSLVKSLVQLQQLKICKCTSMEWVILAEEDGMSEMTMFPRLGFLRLEDLPSLKMFCKCTGNLTWFPSLSRVEIDNCVSMETFISSSRSAKAEGLEEYLHTDMQPLFDEKVALPNLEELLVYNMDNLRRIWDDRLALNSFGKLKDLSVEDCCKLVNIFPSIMCGRLRTLHSFSVSNCKSLEEIFEVQELSCGRTEAIAVGQLREIHLCKLPKLKHAWNLDAQGILFSENLQSLKVHYCDNLKFLFPASIAKGFLQLEELKIISCSLEEIVAKEEVFAETVPRFLFPRLTSLSLKVLPGLRSFYPGIHISEWPVLKNLEIYRCDKVKMFASEFRSLREIHDESQHDIPIEQTLLIVDKIVSPDLEKIPGYQLPITSSCFQHVTNLSMDSCDNLKYLFTEYVVKSVVQLKFLHISNCNFMECVIIMEKESPSKDLFPNLLQLMLKDLPELKRFCNFTGDLVELLSLSELVIDNCPLMETFVSNSICADMTRDRGTEEMNSEDNLHSDKQPLFDKKVSLPNLEKLMAYNMNKLRKIWDDDQLNLESFSKLRDMRVRYCNKLLHIFPSIMHTRLYGLEVLKVWNCDSMEEIFKLQAPSAQETIVIAATQLREMELFHLPNLKHVWNMHNRVILGFENLHSIDVHCCNNLESIFPAFIARDLLQLQVLSISSCMVDEIVHKEEEAETFPRFMFPQLTSLTLTDLPRLRCFYSGIHVSEWLILKQLVVHGCTKLEIFASEFPSLRENHEESQEEISVQHHLFLVDKVAFPSLEELQLSKLPELLHLWKEISQPSENFQNLVTLKVSECNKLTNIVPSSVSFHNLRTLEVSKCDGLISLMTSPTAKTLTQLTRMEITNCKIIEQIITDMGDKENDDQIVFKSLNYLRLLQLPNLTSFCCLGNYDFEFSLLEKVIVGQCPNMGMLEKVDSKKGDEKGHWQDNPETTQQLVKEMVGFRGLKYLKISEFPLLKQLWHDQLLPCSFFSNLTSLVVDKCADMSTAISTNLLQFLNKLEILEVQSCDSLEQVFDLEELSVDGHPGLLSQLSHFYLIDLPRLKHICRSHQKILGFKNLKFLEVQNCNCLRYIFTAANFSELRQLEDMKIINCAMMEVIITKEEGDAADKIVLPLLNSITLESLPDLTCFYSGDNILECPSLKTITITNCKKLEAFVFNRMDHHVHTSPFFSNEVVLPTLEELRLYSIAIEMICDNKLPTSCIQNLEILDISCCDNLQYLLPSCMVKSLVGLQQLSICNCRSMEWVILEEGMNEMMFPRLIGLMLKDLPSLKMFSRWGGNLTQFPLLSCMVIANCVSMEIFISNSVSAKVEGSDEDLHADTLALFDEKVSLPNLKVLIICDMDNLRKIWDDDQLNLNSFSELQEIRVRDCNKLFHIFPSIMHGRLQRLEVLNVWNCNSVEEIFKLQALSGCETNVITATQLRELELYDLPNLKHIWNMHNQVIMGFQNLLSMEVDNCNNLENIFPASIARNLLQLQLLSISSCMVDEIVHTDKEVEAVPRFLFPQLTLLTLMDLPRLRCFCSGIHVSEWPVLRQLVVHDCTKVDILLASEILSLRENHEESQHKISLQHPLFLLDKVAFPCLEELELSKLPELLHLWKENSQPSKTFQNLANLKVSECDKLTNIVPSSVFLHNLTTLEVSKCDGLISLVTSPTARSMMQLTRMNISDCRRIEQIIRVTADLENEVKDEIVFKELKYLGLECLPSLGRFCLGSCTLDFPSLDQLIVRECSNMETFSEGVLRTSELQRLQLTQAEDQRLL